MSDHPSAFAQVPWQKLLIWGIFLLVVYYLRELFLIVFITFLMSYIIGNIVAALKNRIAPGQNRPWLDRGLALATLAGLLVCVGAVFVFFGPRFLQQSRLLLVQIEGFRPQDSLNSLLDRTVGVYLLRRTYGKPGDERYDATFKEYQQQGRYGEGLYHEFPSLKSNLESGFELAYEQTERVLHLQPVMVLAILAIGEHLFGIWGLLLGVPVAVYIIRVVVLDEPIPGIYEPAVATTAREH